MRLFWLKESVFVNGGKADYFMGESLIFSWGRANDAGRIFNLGARFKVKKNVWKRENFLDKPNKDVLEFVYKVKVSDRQVNSCRNIIFLIVIIITLFSYRPSLPES